MTFPYGDPDAHYEAVRRALASDNPWHALNVADVTRRIAQTLPYGTRKDIERVIAEELFHHRVQDTMRTTWAELGLYLQGLP